MEMASRRHDESKHNLMSRAYWSTALFSMNVAPIRIVWSRLQMLRWRSGMLHIIPLGNRLIRITVLRWKEMIKQRSQGEYLAIVRQLILWLAMGEDLHSVNHFCASTSP